MTPSIPELPDTPWTTGTPLAHELDAAATALRQGRATVAAAEIGGLVAPALGDIDKAHLLGLSVAIGLARGDLAEAPRWLRELGEMTTRLGGSERPESLAAAAIAHHVRADLAFAGGEHEQALTHYRHAGDRLPDADTDWVPWRAGLALTLARSGQAAKAEELAQEHLTRSRAEGSSHAVASALRALASVTATGDRVALLEAARTQVPVDATRLAAQVDVDLAGLLLLEPGGRARAVELLRDVEQYAGQRDLPPLSARVRRLLELAGEQPRRVHSDALASLTPAERRVATLVASGMTNRQVAGELVVTIKAVEWHLSHVYRKLGISSRTALAGALGI